MKLKRFKERDNKKIGVVVFTLICLFLVSGAILYRTFAIFEVKTNQNVINGTVQTGDILFTFYYEDDEGNYVITDKIPEGDYVLSTSDSYCGVVGQRDESITVSMNSDKTLEITGLSKSPSKCKLYFEKKQYNPFPENVLASVDQPDEATGNGLYTVDHSKDTDTTLGEEWKAKPELRYAGPDPNNYVTFNNEKWRIIGLVNVKTSDNQVEQRLKIIRDDSIGNYSWDYKTSGKGSSTSSYGSNDWTDSQLMEMLNDGYYYSSSNVSCYKGSSSPNKCDFSGTDPKTKGLEESARDMIDKNIIWNIGGWNTNQVVTSDMYNYERGTSVYASGLPFVRETEWKASNTGRASKETTNKKEPDSSLFRGVALPYPSDYGYATSGSNSGKTRDECINNTTLYSYDSGCYEKDWLKPESGYMWTLSPYSFGSYFVINVNSGGYVGRGNAYHSVGVWPALYLSSKVSISDGQGTVDDPFILSVQ